MSSACCDDDEDMEVTPVSGWGASLYSCTHKYIADKVPMWEIPARARPARFHMRRGAVDLMLHFRSQLVTGIVPFYLEHRVMLNI